MREATRLVTCGWTMDDTHCGRKGWVVARWEVLQRTPWLARVDAAAVSPVAHANCPICYESFQPRDCVVNLSCNHNFHATCASASGGGAGRGGIIEWVASDRSTCPCCRADVTPPL
jgi:hypothetical protein